MRADMERPHSPATHSVNRRLDGVKRRLDSAQPSRAFSHRRDGQTHVNGDQMVVDLRPHSPCQRIASGLNFGYKDELKPGR